MSHELAKALTALNLHRTGEVFWLSYDAEPSNEELGLDAE